MARKFDPFPDPRTAILRGCMARHYNCRLPFEKFSISQAELKIVQARGGDY
jgi:hypothetical protein